MLQIVVQTEESLIKLIFRNLHDFAVFHIFFVTAAEPIGLPTVYPLAERPPALTADNPSAEWRVHCQFIHSVRFLVRCQPLCGFKDFF